MPNNKFSTVITLAATPTEMQNLIKALSRFKSFLTKELGFECTSHEHSYVCGSEHTLVKVIPAYPKEGVGRSLSGFGDVASVIISSLKPREVVKLDEVLRDVLMDEGVTGRRIG